MGLNCGIVGLPNVGKSSLFNALTATADAQAANFPFTTIEPNVGRVALPDPRLDRIAAIAGSAKVTPTFLEFVDIAGLVAGASRGEGLGNQFLAHIREVDAIAQVLRCFVDDNVTHVSGSVDPGRDAEIVETELLLADLESLERRAGPLAKRLRGGERDARETHALVEQVLAGLRDGRPARSLPLADAERKGLRQLHLLTAKPMLYVCNVGEAEVAAGNRWSTAIARRAAAEGTEAVVVSARVEAELAEIDDPALRLQFLEALGLHETGLARVIGAAYRLLDLITFFTAGPKEARAWTIRRGTRAAEAAGTIHSDFERGFIRAETIAYDDYLRCEGEQGAREAGRLRLEGRDYLVADGDVLLFRFNV
jgi:hypothetical protein